MVHGMEIAGIAVAGYLGLVVAFESLVGYMGRRHARRGVQAGETWLLITATVDGEDRSVVVAGVKSARRTYVAANHWPRTWYRRVVENPDVRVTVSGQAGRPSRRAGQRRRAFADRPGIPPAADRADPERLPAARVPEARPRRPRAGAVGRPMPADAAHTRGAVGSMSAPDLPGADASRPEDADCPLRRPTTRPSGAHLACPNASSQLVQDAEPFLYRSTCRERSEPGLRVMLCDGDGAQLFHELVDAHRALSRESLHPCMRIVRETDGQRRHGSGLGNERSGRHDAQRMEAQLGSVEISRVVGYVLSRGVGYLVFLGAFQFREPQPSALVT